jgi:hypothetical protein
MNYDYKPMTPYEIERLGHYLAGLIEGAGVFTPTQLAIFLHPQDREYAHGLQRRLGFGRVVPKKRQGNIAFILKSKRDLRDIIDLVKDKFVGERSIKELLHHGFQTRFKIPILPPQGTISLYNHWLAGFLDGTAHFEILVKPRALVQVKISGKDLQHLALIRSFLKIAKSQLTPLDGNYTLIIRGKKRLTTLLKYLEEYAIGTRKTMELEIFRDASVLIEAKSHLSVEGLAKITDLQRKLREVYK